LLRKALKVRSHILLLLLVKCERKEINWGGKKKKNRSRILFFKKTSHYPVGRRCFSEETHCQPRE
jgi:hypothetical protein